MTAFDWTKVRVGDAFTVKRSSFFRSGMTGFVISFGPRDKEPAVDEKGVSLDFYCDAFGNPHGLPSIEWWEWSELQLPDVEATA